jgi:predicted amino acid-binding ACT domain protein
MSVSLVLTVIGDDRPGLVEQLATAISQHQGNWLESSMSNLSGKFAGIVCVSVSETHLEALTAAMASLPGLRITFEVSRSPAAQAGNRRLKLSLVGHDRIGIVREVSQVLARHALRLGFAAAAILPEIDRQVDHEADKGQEAGELEIERVVGAVPAGEGVVDRAEDAHTLHDLLQRADLGRDRRAGDQELERFGEVFGGELLAIDLADDPALRRRPSSPG